MSREIFDPWSELGSTFATDVLVQEGRTTCVLGPDGNPVRYLRRHQVGFDLRPKSEREGE